MTDATRNAIIRAFAESVESPANKTADREWLGLEGFRFSQRTALNALKHPETAEGKVIIANFDLQVKFFGLSHVIQSFTPPNFPDAAPLQRTL